VGISDTGALTDIRERAVPVVVEEMIVFADQSQRSTHGPNSTELARTQGEAVLAWNGRMIGIELQVTGDKQIQQPIMVVVTPSRAC